MRKILLSGLLLGVAACGARSGLSVGGGGAGGGDATVSSSGAGASSTTSGPGSGPTTTTSTVGSGGGLPTDCQLTVVVPVAQVQEAVGQMPNWTTLAYASDDRQRVLVAYGTQPNPVLYAVRHTSFFPWDNWPDNGLIPGGHGTALTADSPIFAAGLVGENVGILARTSSLNFAAGPPDQEFWSSASLYGSFDAGRGLAVARGPVDDLALFEFPIDTDVMGLAAGTVGLGAAGVYYNGPQVLGCGFPNVLADAVSVGSEWLLASATSQPIGPCGLDQVGPPSMLQVSRLDASGALLETTEALFAGTSFGAVAMSERPDGAWLGWTTAGRSASTFVARVDGTGHLAAGAFDVTNHSFPALNGSTIALAPFRDDVLVGWQSGDRIVLALVTPEGFNVAQGEIPFFGKFQGQLSMLGSPAGDAVLVGWSTSDINAKAAGLVAKVLCQ